MSIDLKAQNTKLFFSLLPSHFACHAEEAIELSIWDTFNKQNRWTAGGTFALTNPQRWASRRDSHSLSTFHPLYAWSFGLFTELFCTYNIHVKQHISTRRLIEFATHQTHHKKTQFNQVIYTHPPPDKQTQNLHGYIKKKNKKKLPQILAITEQKERINWRRYLIPNTLSDCSVRCGPSKRWTRFDRLNRWWRTGALV